MLAKVMVKNEDQKPPFAELTGIPMLLKLPKRLVKIATADHSKS